MRHIILVITFLGLTMFCSAQNEDSIYSFMNKGLPEQEFGKSSWGMFFLDCPYLIDSNLCHQILEADWNEQENILRDEFYNLCLSLNIEWQRKFKWKQTKFFKNIIVGGTRKKLTPSVVATLQLTKRKKLEAQHWIAEWNNTKVDNRLVNYSSIPVFSLDKNYVLIIRGQHVRSEGGWDTIYIYKMINKQWSIWKKIKLTEI